MAIAVNTVGNHMTITLGGEVDHHNAKTMIEGIQREVDYQLPKILTLSLEGVTFMDSSGIALLFRAKRQMDSLGGKFSVTHIPNQASRMLHAAHMGQWIDMGSEK